MKPTIGRIVTIRDKNQPDREFAAVVSRVWGEGEAPAINAHVFVDSGVEVKTSVAHASREGFDVTWDWPARV